MKTRRKALLALEGAPEDFAEPENGAPPTSPVELPNEEAPPDVEPPGGEAAEAAPLPPVSDFVDVERLNARESDRDAYNQRVDETALRQLVAGLTRTQAPVSVSPLGTAEKDLLSERRQRQTDALRALEAQNNAARTDAYVEQGRGAAANRAAAGDAQRAKLDADRIEADRKDAREKARLALQQAELDRRKALDARKAAGAGGPRAPSVADRRQKMREDALSARAGWEKIDPNAIAFRDTDQAKKFDDAVTAMDAIKNHRDHVLHELEVLRKAKTPAEIDTAIGRLNAQMGALAAKLRAAEGLNNTDAANHAIETMLSLQNGSAVNWRNALNEGRLPSIINAAVASGEANIDTLAKNANLRRSKGAAKPAGEPSAAAGKSDAPSGVVIFVDENGDELDVDESKADAFAAKHPKLRRK